MANNPKHHLIFVSKQSLPTILGISLPGSEPTHIHAIVTQQMLEDAKLLEKVLNSRGQNYHFNKYHLDNTTSQKRIYQVLNKIREACLGESLSINLTGGTKLMALAAWEWAYSYNIPAFYIDTANELVIKIDNEWQYTPLPDILTVKDLLAAQGYEMEVGDTTPVPAKRREILSRLLTLACSPEGDLALGRLNTLATTAGPDLCLPKVDNPSPTWKKLISICTEAGTLQNKSGRLAFKNEKARHWCNGIWFEEYVKMILYHLKEKQLLKDWITSVKVRSKGVMNEMDALFTCRNRLFTIECKTTSMGYKGASQANKVPPVLYKADSLHDRLGGTYTKAMLCSVRQLKDDDLNRAKNMGVKVVFGQNLLKLEDILINWTKK